MVFKHSLSILQVFSMKSDTFAQEPQIFFFSLSAGIFRWGVTAGQVASRPDVGYSQPVGWPAG